MAPYHQHLFNLRIDPAVGGHKNTFVTSDSVCIPWDEELNPLGTGYTTKEKFVYRAGPVDDDVVKGRVFKIVNENEINPVSLTPIGYKVVPIRSQVRAPRVLPPFWISLVTCPADAARTARLMALETVRVRRAPTLGHQVQREAAVPGRAVYQPIPGRDRHQVVDSASGRRQERRHSHLAHVRADAQPERFVQ